MSAARLTAGQAAAAELAAFRRSYFAGARHDRLNLDWIAGNVSADDEVRVDARKLRARARELARNEPLIKRYLQLAAVNVIGPSGFVLQAKVTNNDGLPAERMNAEIERGWYDWARNVSTGGRMSLVTFEQLAFATYKTDGEVFIHEHRGFMGNPHGYALELIDADLIDENYNVPPGKDQNEIRMGIEVDGRGAPLAYHVWNRPWSIYTSPNKRIRIPASEIIHVFKRQRPNQTRGYTHFHAAMETLHYLYGYRKAEVLAARYASEKGIYLKSTENAVLDDPKNAKTPMVLESAFGQVDKLPFGWDLGQLDPEHPTTAYAPFTQQLQADIAVSLGVSYQSLTGDLSRTSFASGRIGWADERDQWKNEQEHWLEEFEARVYPAWLEMSRLTGFASGGAQGITLDSRDSRRFLEVGWIGRRWDWFDPYKDALAAVLMIENGLDCRTDIVARKGGDWEDVRAKLEKETVWAAEKGVPITSAAGAAAAAATGAANADQSGTDAGETGGSNGKGYTGRVARALLAEIAREGREERANGR